MTKVTVGHLPKEISKTVTCTATGKYRHSEITEGLKVPCRISFRAHPQMIALLQTLQGRSYQFEFKMRLEGAYRSMCTLRGDYANIIVAS